MDRDFRRRGSRFLLHARARAIAHSQDARGRGRIPKIGENLWGREIAGVIVDVNFLLALKLFGACACVRCWDGRLRTRSAIGRGSKVRARRVRARGAARVPI